MSRPTRRGLFGAAALTVIPLAAHPAAPHPDAELIAACSAWLATTRAFNAQIAMVPIDMDVEDDHPACALLGRLPPLTEKIVALRATTPEGFLARAQCMASGYLPHHPACQDNPGAAPEDRFEAAMFRDLTVMERGERA